MSVDRLTGHRALASTVADTPRRGPTGATGVATTRSTMIRLAAVSAFALLAFGSSPATGSAGDGPAPQQICTRLIGLHGHWGPVVGPCSAMPSQP